MIMSFLWQDKVFIVSMVKSFALVIRLAIFFFDNLTNSQLDLNQLNWEAIEFFSK